MIWQKMTDTRKTMFDFIIWYNDLKLNVICKECPMSMPTLLALKDGSSNRKFNKRTLDALSEYLGIKTSDYYDLENDVPIYWQP